ncbi:hypothetical protein, partial [Lactobacillus delbrueckii]|uniref:hypothetical protein n=1 Tax=Lactobacillus delbrueckii TaxID=1584 RepID=UPI0021A4C4ED
LTPNLTAFTGVDSQNLLDVMVSVQFILAIGDKYILKENDVLPVSALSIIQAGCYCLSSPGEKDRSCKLLQIENGQPA